ncbi:MAG: N-acetyltransferase [Saccharofermentans sp.]|nr:N-acetyltransferase [Saccharofermentans sp.]
MEIVKSTIADIDSICAIYENARKFMSDNGNPNQWTDGYPTYEDAMADINSGNSYVIKDGSSIVGVFVFIIGEEPTYKVIEDGAWNYDSTYGTIHRIASNGQVKDISRICFEYCLNFIDYLRIDTHRNNLPMRVAVSRFGFTECGTIYVRNGARIAYDYKK